MKISKEDISLLQSIVEDYKHYVDFYMSDSFEDQKASDLDAIARVKRFIARLEVEHE